MFLDFITTATTAHGLQLHTTKTQNHLHLDIKARKVQDSGSSQGMNIEVPPTELKITHFGQFLTFKKRRTSPV